MKHSAETQKPVILFDGMCNYCSGAINFIARHDTDDHFLFSASQSEAGKELVKKYSLETISDKSVILIDNREIVVKSTAILQVYKQLNGLLPLLYVLILVPRFLRDAFYNVIAGNRYQWFGRRESCIVPDERLKKKFLT